MIVKLPKSEEINFTYHLECLLQYVAFLLAVTHYRVNPDGKYKVRNSVSTDRYIRYYGI
jgi:hypothetical protein